jgi:hypothetical protein
MTRSSAKSLQVLAAALLCTTLAAPLGADTKSARDLA